MYADQKPFVFVRTNSYPIVMTLKINTVMAILGNKGNTENVYFYLMKRFYQHAIFLLTNSDE